MANQARSWVEATAAGPESELWCNRVGEKWIHTILICGCLSPGVCLSERSISLCISCHALYRMSVIRCCMHFEYSCECRSSAGYWEVADAMSQGMTMMLLMGEAQSGSSQWKTLQPNNLILLWNQMRWSCRWWKPEVCGWAFLEGLWSVCCRLHAHIQCNYRAGYLWPVWVSADSAIFCTLSSGIFFVSFLEAVGSD